MNNLAKVFLLIMIGATLTACVPTPAALPTPSLVPPTQPLPVGYVQTQAPAALPQTDADVPRVTPADAKAAFERGEAIIVDVRSAESYAAEHIQGALNTTTDLDKSKWIITYCT